MGGLRHLDETVRFCNMGSGDRVGHALALGLIPSDWARRQVRAFVPLEAHVDNLVWLWHHATTLCRGLPAAGAILAGLERRIAYYAGRLWGHGPSPETLYRAWKLRGNCPLSVLRGAGEAGFPDVRYWVPDHHEFQDRGSPVYQAWSDHLHQRRPRDDRTRMITVLLNEDGPLEPETDRFGPAELDFVEALQDHLMTEYDLLGVVIEACPSSNWFIGRIAHVGEHPCLRWHPPLPDLLAPGAKFNRFGLRRGPVKVCLNTDDPGIFPTTIAHEHRTVRDAACDRFSLSHWQAETWINGLRMTGLDVFQQVHAHIRYRNTLRMAPS